MKRLVFSLILFFSFLSPALAASSDYTVENFDSKIVINQDTSLTVEETILVNFHLKKHGIFRIIPTTYSANGKTIKADFKLLSLTDEEGISYPYTTSRLNKSIKLKIGDPDKTISGFNTYIIKYRIKEVLLRHKEHDEVYWNVAGSEWDTTIKKTTAAVSSSFAPITKVTCYAGQVGQQGKTCEASHTEDKANFYSTAPLSWGKDLTIVVALNQKNQLQFPGPIEQIFNFLVDNWGYLLALIPISLLFYFWFKKGRDLRYLSDNVFYKPENQKTKTVSLFAREHLPTVYRPIDGLTPAEVGTLIDEKVDIQDVVAEIVELARLGYLEIKKVETKKLIGKKVDYLFIKKDKNPSQLKSYQKYLLEKIFGITKVADFLKEIDKLKLPAGIKTLIKGFPELGERTKLSLVKGNTEAVASAPGVVLLSSLKNHFYLHLEEFKKKLYEHLATEKLFTGNPSKIKLKWTGIFSVLLMATFGGSIVFTSLTANSGPIILTLLSIIPAAFLIKGMPQKSAWGHSLYRQAVGLRWYVDKGKWREEIHEKHLFLEEILPLAICLGVVKKLSKDMAVLGVKPPAYFSGITTGNLSSSLNYFSTQAASNLISSPKSQWSGSSSWSGGSGFSGGGGGGFSGGGFGGGGGGSW